MGDLLRDLNYGVRSLLKDRAFTITALVTLGVCIAVYTATFAIVNSVLLRPLPVPDAERTLLQRATRVFIGEAPRISSSNQNNSIDQR